MARKNVLTEIIMGAYGEGYGSSWHPDNGNGTTKGGCGPILLYLLIFLAASMILGAAGFFEGL